MKIETKGWSQKLVCVIVLLVTFGCFASSAEDMDIQALREKMARQEAILSELQEKMNASSPKRPVVSFKRSTHFIDTDKLSFFYNMCVIPEFNLYSIPPPPMSQFSDYYEVQDRDIVQTIVPDAGSFKSEAFWPTPANPILPLIRGWGDDVPWNYDAHDDNPE